MTYILVIWTVVAFAGAPSSQYSAQFRVERDWRPIGAFHQEDLRPNAKSAKELCEEAARELGYTSTASYRCVRSR